MKSAPVQRLRRGGEVLSGLDHRAAPGASYGSAGGRRDPPWARAAGDEIGRLLPSGSTPAA